MLKPQPVRLALITLITCVACGSRFEAAGAGGEANDGGASQAGAQTSAGDSSGGASAAGAADGGSTASAGWNGFGGRYGGGWSGAASGGQSTGGSAGSDCTELKTEYAALVKQARVCDKGSTDECSTASTAPVVENCGCPTLINQKSEYAAQVAAKYQEIQKAKCMSGLTCNIACLPVTSASCAATMSTSAVEFTCTGTTGGIAN